MKKIFSIITVLAITAMIIPSSAQALTAAELQEQINALLAQLSQLQSQLSTLEGGTPSGTVTGCAITSFTRNLKQGTTGDDVKCLQIVLNSASDTQLSAGVGSPGQETSYFGPKTKAAVIKFQEKYASEILASWGLTSGTGYVGSTTLAKLNSMLAGGVVPPPPGVVCGNGVCETGETSTNCPADCPVTPAGGLTISLAYDTPASATIPYGVYNQPFTKVNLTAGTGGDVSLSKITVTRSGLSADTDVDLVKIFDGTIQKGNSASLNSNHKAVFSLSTPIVVTAGTTKTLTIKVDLDAAAGTGRTMIMSIAAASDIVSNASSTSGSASGNLMTISAITIGSLTIAAGPDNPTSNLAPDVGDTNVRILQMKLTGGSTEDVEVTQVIATENGTSTTTDISKVELYNDSDGVSLGEVSSFDAEGRATFDLATPLLIAKGTTKNLSVRVDIISGSSRTVSAKVKDAGAYTLTAIGKTYGYGVGFGSSSWAGTATAQTIGAGSLTVTKSASTPATGYITPGATAAPIVTFALEAKGEPVTITEFNNTVLLTTATYDYVTGCSIYDASGNVVAGPVDATTATDDYIHFTDTLEVPLGVHTYTIKCNLSSSITAGDIQIGFDDSNVGENSGGNAPDVAITCKGSISNDSITPTPADADVLGNVLTFQVADLDITTKTTPPASYIVKGQQNVHFANIEFSAVSSGENVNITSITVHNTPDTANTEDDIQNIRLFSSTISQANCIGSGRAWDSTLAMCRLAAIKQGVEGTHTTVFTLSTPLVVTKGGSQTVKVYGDFSASATTSSNHTFDIDAVTDITAIGATTGTTLTTAMKGTTPTGSGQKMSYSATGGDVTVALDYGAPASNNVAIGQYGTTGIVMTKLKLTAGYEDVDIDYIDLTRSSANTIGAGADADIANVYLYEGSNLLAKGTLKSINKYRFDLSNYKITAYANKVWTVKADFNGTLTGATSQHGNAFDLAAVGDLYATGLASGTAVDATTTVTSQADTYIFRSTPKFEIISPSSTVLYSSNDQELIRIKITANSAGDIEFTNGDGNYIRFTLSGSVTDHDTTGTTENFVLKNITDSNTIDTVTTDVSNIVAGRGGNDAAYMVKFSTLTNPLQIAAGESKIITLEADLGDFEGGGDTIQATIGNTGSDLGWSDIDTANVTSANAYFIWLPLLGPSLVKPAT